MYSKSDSVPTDRRALLIGTGSMVIVSTFPGAAVASIRNVSLTGLAGRVIAGWAGERVLDHLWSRATGSDQAKKMQVSMDRGGYTQAQSYHHVRERPVMIGRKGVNKDVCLGTATETGSPMMFEGGALYSLNKLQKRLEQSGLTVGEVTDLTFPVRPGNMDDGTILKGSTKPTTYQAKEAEVAMSWNTWRNRGELFGQGRYKFKHKKRTYSGITDTVRLIG